MDETAALKSFMKLFSEIRHRRLNDSASSEKRKALMKMLSRCYDEDVKLSASIHYQP